MDRQAILITGQAETILPSQVSLLKRVALLIFVSTQSLMICTMPEYNYPEIIQSFRKLMSSQA